MSPVPIINSVRPPPTTQPNPTICHYPRILCSVFPPCTPYNPPYRLLRIVSQLRTVCERTKHTEYSVLAIASNNLPRGLSQLTPYVSPTPSLEGGEGGNRTSFTYTIRTQLLHYHRHRLHLVLTYSLNANQRRPRDCFPLTVLEGCASSYLLGASFIS